MGCANLTIQRPKALYFSCGKVVEINLRRKQGSKPFSGELNATTARVLVTTPPHPFSLGAASRYWPLRKQYSNPFPRVNSGSLRRPPFQSPAKHRRKSLSSRSFLIPSWHGFAAYTTVSWLHGIRHSARVALSRGCWSLHSVCDLQSGS